MEITPLPLGSTTSLIGLVAVIFPLESDKPSLTLFVSIYCNNSCGIISLI